MSANALSLTDVLARLRCALRSGQIEESQVEAEVLLRHVLGLDRASFLTLTYGRNESLTHDQSQELNELLRRRLSGEALAYIVGEREFYGLRIDVTEDVLIPRPETELLVDIATQHVRGARLASPVVVDAGTGSGALALAIAAHTRIARVVATDISSGALAVARRNATKLGLSHRIEFVRGNMLAPIDGPIDVVVSNPPYIPSSQIAELAVEVQQEPRIALDGGFDGLDPLRDLLEQARSRLADTGVMLVELMPEQMEQASILAASSMGADVKVTTRKDLMGNDRVLTIQNGPKGHDLHR